jgi:hypothetical protein
MKLFEITAGVFVFGILNILVGLVIAYTLKKLNLIKMSPECEDCKDWNKNHVMELSLFLTGAIVWILSYLISHWKST